MEDPLPDMAPTVPPAGPRPAITVPEAPSSLAYRLSKRAIDVGVAGIGLILLSPIMLAAALAVRLESGGPSLFRQQRLGLAGRPFTMLKFRSMHAAADEDIHRAHVEELIRGGSAAAEPEARDRATWVPIESDARVTRVGSILRRTHVDERPQLLNVLAGQMSLVGPRPPIPYEVELYQPWQLRRLSVPPGMTGLWQATGWGRLTFDEGVALDLQYVDSRSLRTDLGLLGRTLWQLVTRRQY